MTRKVRMGSVAGAAGVLLALAVESAGDAPGLRTYANAHVVAVDAQARTITVRGGAVGKDETFPAEAQALAKVGTLKAGQQVVLTLRAGSPGPEVVTHIEPSVAGVGPHRATTTRRAPRRRSSAGSPTVPSAPSPAPTATPKRLPTDTAGPLRDPRKEPNVDPRDNPLRDPRVVPGLSEPVPTPRPSPPTRG
jgi:hypothetical protein